MVGGLASATALIHHNTISVRPVTGLVEMIYMMLYEEESKGLDGREDIYKMARALSRDTSPSPKRLPTPKPLSYGPFPFHIPLRAVMTRCM